MKVAIIGAGNVGTALAAALTRAGHKVTITARDPKHATKAAESGSHRPRSTPLRKHPTAAASQPL